MPPTFADRKPKITFRSVYGNIGFRLKDGTEETRSETYLNLSEQEHERAQWEAAGWSVRCSLVIFGITVDPDGTKRFVR